MYYFRCIACVILYTIKLFVRGFVVYDFRKNTCVVVEFASLDGVFTDLYDSKTKKD